MLIKLEGPITPEQIDAVQAAFNAQADYFSQQLKEVMVQYQGLSQGGAADVVYLRTRSRHTPELEARLVASHMAGKTININDWPYHEDGNYDPFTGEPL
jgi:hypothetical protein